MKTDGWINIQKLRIRKCSTGHHTLSDRTQKGIEGKNEKRNVLNEKEFHSHEDSHTHKIKYRISLFILLKRENRENSVKCV